MRACPAVFGAVWHSSLSSTRFFFRACVHFRVCAHHPPLTFTSPTCLHFKQVAMAAAIGNDSRERHVERQTQVPQPQHSLVDTPSTQYSTTDSPPPFDPPVEDHVFLNEFGELLAELTSDLDPL